MINANNEYQGWRNKATWMVKLHLSEMDITTWTDHDLMSVPETISEGGSAIQEFVTDMLLEEVDFNRLCLMAQDLLQMTLQTVDWFQIASSFNDEAEARKEVK